MSLNNYMKWKQHKRENRYTFSMFFLDVLRKRLRKKPDINWTTSRWQRGLTLHSKKLLCGWQIFQPIVYMLKSEWSAAVGNPSGDQLELRGRSRWYLCLWMFREFLVGQVLEQSGHWNPPPSRCFASAKTVDEIHPQTTFRAVLRIRDI